MGEQAIYFCNRRNINTRFVCVCVCVCFSSPSLPRCPGRNMAEADSCRLFTTGRYRSCTADIAGWSNLFFFFLSVEERKRVRTEGHLLWQHTADGQRKTGVCMKVHFFLKIHHRSFPLYNSPLIFSIVFPFLSYFLSPPTQRCFLCTLFVLCFNDFPFSWPITTIFINITFLF